MARNDYSERFAGKTIIVTGAGSGIGRATASRVAREGKETWRSGRHSIQRDEFKTSRRRGWFTGGLMGRTDYYRASHDICIDTT